MLFVLHFDVLEGFFSLLALLLEHLVVLLVALFQFKLLEHDFLLLLEEDLFSNPSRRGGKYFLARDFLTRSWMA